jgi:hypothetical protein
MFICYMQSSCAPPLLPVFPVVIFQQRTIFLLQWEDGRLGHRNHSIFILECLRYHYGIFIYIKKTLCPTCSTAPLFDSEFSAPHLWPAVVIQETKVHRIQHCTLIPIVFSIVEIHWQALYYAAMLSFSFFSNRGHCPFSIEEWKYQMFTGRNLTRNRMVDGHRILSFSLL